MTAHTPGPADPAGPDTAGTPSAVPAAGTGPATGRPALARALRAAVPGLLLAWLAPLLAYALLRPHTGSETTALALGAALPVAFTLGEFLWHRRLDPVGAAGCAGFALALAATALTGGNSLVLKLHDTWLTGPLGLAMLLSAALRKPLLAPVLRRAMARRGIPREAPGRDGRNGSRPVTVLTALAGTVLLVHALVIVILARTLPTATFLSVSRPVGLAALGAGFLPLLWYRARLRRALAAPGQAPQPNPPSNTSAAVRR